MNQQDHEPSSFSHLTPIGQKVQKLKDSSRAPYQDLYEPSHVRVSSQLSSNSSVEMKDLFTSGHIRKKSPSLGYHQHRRHKRNL